MQVPQHVLNSVLGEGATEEKGETAQMVRSYFNARMIPLRTRCLAAAQLLLFQHRAALGALQLPA